MKFIVGKKYKVVLKSGRVLSKEKVLKVEKDRVLLANDYLFASKWFDYSDIKSAKRVLL